ncbi:hypothetical protein PAT3040_04112 [Paenibacillus agaridevorans]|uniref:Uncharacterized protein n=1 Tax=Paenibacillus agaridevorans TaxID=171404 RepID=A0A2R5ERY8_9BACL|nr:hypothetical protein [Paenibacillus agaridevorans]GBG09466.1 hypothetical protein PAT3040_04112 [Paenibacillus agaridevorans]
MDSERIKAIVSALNGLRAQEWARVKQQVDMLYSFQAAKVQFDDLEQLKTNLEYEFKLRRFGEKSD